MQTRTVTRDEAGAAYNAWQAGTRESFALYFPRLRPVLARHSMPMAEAAVATGIRDPRTTTSAFLLARGEPNDLRIATTQIRLRTTANNGKGAERANNSEALLNVLFPFM